MIQPAGAVAQSVGNGQGVIALLDLPIRSSISLNGHSIVLQRDDFVAIDEIPLPSCDGGGDKTSCFYLVTIRPGQKEEKASSMGITTGFVIVRNGLTLHNGYCMLLARRFDSQTEEVSSLPLDDASASNLLETIASNRMEQQRIVSYNNIMKSSVQSNNYDWVHQTNFVSPELLKSRGLSSGDKVVPGTFEMDSDTELKSPKENNNSKPREATVVDGISVNYPPVPVFLDSHALRTTRHDGTRRYLSALAPSEKTALFVGSTPPANLVLERLLKVYFNDDWKSILGDLQLSFVLFVYLQCLSSMEHWRDLIAMLSCVQLDPSSVTEWQLALYGELLALLCVQMSFIEQDLFEDIELSGDNFFVPALRRLIDLCSRVSDKDDKLKKSVDDLSVAISNKFPVELLPDETPLSDPDSLSASRRIDADTEMEDAEAFSDDEDGPVIVASEEVEAAMARPQPPVTNKLLYPAEHVESYPLLFASLAPREDVLMACARILDEANDVTLVRQAAAYLEEVEANK